jgi:pheromone shutdown-related protein TraB
LDENRLKSIIEEDTWKNLDLTKVFKEGKSFLLIANLLLSAFQRKMGTDLGIKPGTEMKVAVETTKELGIPYSLCDRDIQITLRRAWVRCSLWSKFKLIATLLSSVFFNEKLSEKEIENLKSRNELESMMDELSKYLPEIKETLIDERDRYLASKIWSSNKKGKSVAVVGAGHLLGIRAYLEKISLGTAKEELADLELVPKSKVSLKMLGWIVPMVILSLILLGFFRFGFETVLEMIKVFVIIKSSLAALGSLIALAHPLTILVAFLGAPIAATTPLISIGVLTGITEATMRKPRVSDAENISDDISSLKGVYRNRITRALLVFFLSALGSSIGSFVSIPALTSLLSR